MLDPRDTWYTDQLITTYTLLSNRLCTVPQISGLWKLPGLSYDPDFSDEDQCWHGRGYKDCNKDIHIVYQGCKWWHFYPDQSFDDHLKKFYELTNNSIKIDLQLFTWYHNQDAKQRFSEHFGMMKGSIIVGREIMQHIRG